MKRWIYESYILIPVSEYLEDDSSSSHSSPETSATTTPETGRTPLPQHMHAHMGSDVSTLTPDSPQSRSPSHRWVHYRPVINMVSFLQNTHKSTP